MADMRLSATFNEAVASAAREGARDALAKVSDALSLADKLGIPEWKVAVALQRRNGNANQAAEYLFTHLDKDDGFWDRPPGGAAAEIGIKEASFVVPVARRMIERDSTAATWSRSFAAQAPFRCYSVQTTRMCFAPKKMVA